MENIQYQHFPAICQWRDLRADDVPRLVKIAEEIHPGLFESEEVFGERVTLFPEGCMALVNRHASLCGYAISHPIRLRQIPPLNRLLGGIDLDAEQYFIHDIAILKKYRGLGHARQCVCEQVCKYAVKRDSLTVLRRQTYGDRRTVSNVLPGIRLWNLPILGPVRIRPVSNRRGAGEESGTLW
jgi:ribosomal protein S18 acetylase RimI-like enzyme